jgi:hypothetical protein
MVGKHVLDRRVGVHWSNDNLELGVDAGLLLGVRADKADSTNTFAVQAEILPLSPVLAQSKVAKE